DRDQCRALWSSWNPGAINDWTYRVARLHPHDELGRGTFGVAREGWNTGCFEMKKRRQGRGRIVPALVLSLYAGLAFGWWLHGAIASAPRGSTSADRPVRTNGDSTGPTPNVVPHGEDVRPTAPTIAVDPIAE